MAPTGDAASGPLRRLGALLLALGRIRLELISIEIQEEKERVAALLAWAVLTALLAGFGAVFLALFVTVALWDTHRLAALGAGALLFAGGAVFALLRVRRLLGARDAPFASSIAELRDDARALQRGESQR